MNKNRILSLVTEMGGIVTTKEIISAGWNQYHIKSLLEDGLIEKVKRGIYRLNSSEVSEYAEVSKVVNKGVFCMFTAAALHELTTFIPREFQLAIPRKSKVVLPDYPAIKLFYWNEKQYHIGKTELIKDGTKVRVYNKEKTVCDFLKYRTKLDFASVKEVLKTYLLDDERDLSKLSDYAGELRVKSILNNYLEILL